MGFQLSKLDIDNVIACVPNAVESVLMVVRNQIESYLNRT